MARRPERNHEAYNESGLLNLGLTSLDIINIGFLLLLTLLTTKSIYLGVSLTSSWSIFLSKISSSKQEQKVWLLYNWRGASRLTCLGCRASILAAELRFATDVAQKSIAHVQAHFSLPHSPRRFCRMGRRKVSLYASYGFFDSLR